MVASSHRISAHAGTERGVFFMVFSISFRLLARAAAAKDAIRVSRVLGFVRFQHQLPRASRPSRRAGESGTLLPGMRCLPPASPALGTRRLPASPQNHKADGRNQRGAGEEGNHLAQAQSPHRPGNSAARLVPRARAF